MSGSMHTLSVLVQNRPGVLTRCAGLFARRGFNIESLAVGPTEEPSRSRITIRVDCSQHSVDQVTKQLYKLVDVLKVSELGETAVELELLMIKVTSAPAPPLRLQVIAGEAFTTEGSGSDSYALLRIPVTGGPPVTVATCTNVTPSARR